MHGTAAVPMLDPRGVRFSAGLSAAVLVVVLATGSAWLALVQAVVFGFTAASPAQGPYLVIYRSLLARYLAPPAASWPATPVRLAHLAGLCLVVAAAAGYLAGLPVLGAVLAAVALAVAVLTALDLGRWWPR